MLMTAEREKLRQAQKKEVAVHFGMMAALLALSAAVVLMHVFGLGKVTEAAGNPESARIMQMVLAGLAVVDVVAMFVLRSKVLNPQKLLTVPEDLQITQGADISRLATIITDAFIVSMAIYGFVQFWLVRSVTGYACFAAPAFMLMIIFFPALQRAEDLIERARELGKNLR
jgi:hypothetical protein